MAEDRATSVAHLSDVGAVSAQQIAALRLSEPHGEFSKAEQGIGVPMVCPLSEQG